MNTAYARIRRSILGFLAFGVLLAAACSDSTRDAGAMEYKKYLIVRDLKSSYHTEPKTSTKYPLIEGALVNLGSKALIAVQFTLRFKDHSQNVIYTEQAYPVYVSEFGRKDVNLPLAAGAKTRFAFKSLRCPPNWQPGAVDIEITKIVFE